MLLSKNLGETTKPVIIIVYLSLVVGCVLLAVEWIGFAKVNNTKLPFQTETISNDTIKRTSPVLVELFTSEGCSSCPAAERLVATAQNEFADGVIVLSYHVDYWDRLGWKDPFSSSIYSERQRRYARYFKKDGVYTPQAVVDGRTQFVGSNKNDLWKAIKAREPGRQQSIQIQPTVSVNSLEVIYSTVDLQAQQEVVLLLVQKSAVTNVKSGENGGATLQHINIVRAITTDPNTSNKVWFPLPTGFVKNNYMIVAFIQNKKDLHISNATRINIM